MKKLSLGLLIGSLIALKTTADPVRRSEAAEPEPSGLQFAIDKYENVELEADQQKPGLPDACLTLTEIKNLADGEAEYFCTLLNLTCPDAHDDRITYLVTQLELLGLEDDDLILEDVWEWGDDLIPVGNDTRPLKKNCIKRKDLAVLAKNGIKSESPKDAADSKAVNEVKDNLDLGLIKARSKRQSGDNSRDLDRAVVDSADSCFTKKKLSKMDYNELQFVCADLEILCAGSIPQVILKVVGEMLKRGVPDPAKLLVEMPDLTRTECIRNQDESVDVGSGEGPARATESQTTPMPSTVVPPLVEPPTVGPMSLTKCITVASLNSLTGGQVRRLAEKLGLTCTGATSDCVLVIIGHLTTTGAVGATSLLDSQVMLPQEPGEVLKCLTLLDLEEGRSKPAIRPGKQPTKDDILNSMSPHDNSHFISPNEASGNGGSASHSAQEEKSSVASEDCLTLSSLKTLIPEEIKSLCKGLDLSCPDSETECLLLIIGHFAATGQLNTKDISRTTLRKGGQNICLRRKDLGLDPSWGRPVKTIAPKQFHAPVPEECITVESLKHLVPEEVRRLCSYLNMICPEDENECLLVIIGHLATSGLLDSANLLKSELKRAGDDVCITRSALGLPEDFRVKDRSVKPRVVQAAAPPLPDNCLTLKSLSKLVPEEIKHLCENLNLGSGCPDDETECLLVIVGHFAATGQLNPADLLGSELKWQNEDGVCIKRSHLGLAPDWDRAAPVPKLAAPVPDDCLTVESLYKLVPSAIRKLCKNLNIECPQDESECRLMIIGHFAGKGILDPDDFVNSKLLVSRESELCIRRSDLGLAPGWDQRMAVLVQKPKPLRDDCLDLKSLKRLLPDEIKYLCRNLNLSCPESDRECLLVVIGHFAGRGMLELEDVLEKDRDTDICVRRSDLGLAQDWARMAHVSELQWMDADFTGYSDECYMTKYLKDMSIEELGYLSRELGIPVVSSKKTAINLITRRFSTENDNAGANILIKMPKIQPMYEHHVDGTLPQVYEVLDECKGYVHRIGVSRSVDKDKIPSPKPVPDKVPKPVAKPDPKPPQPKPVVKPKPAPQPPKPEPVKPAPQPPKPEPVKPAPQPPKPEPVKPAPQPPKPEPVKPAPQPPKPEPVKPAEKPAPKPVVKPEEPRPIEEPLEKKVQKPVVQPAGKKSVVKTTQPKSVEKTSREKVPEPVVQPTPAKTKPVVPTIVKPIRESKVTPDVTDPIDKPDIVPMKPKPISEPLTKTDSSSSSESKSDDELETASGMDGTDEPDDIKDHHLVPRVELLEQRQAVLWKVTEKERLQQDFSSIFMKSGNETSGVFGLDLKPWTWISDAPCLATYQCVVGKTCQENICKDSSEPERLHVHNKRCVFQYECPAHYYCSDDTCIFEPGKTAHYVGRFCDVDYKCPPTYYCMQAHKTCILGAHRIHVEGVKCGYDYQCPADYTCRNLTCYHTPAEPVHVAGKHCDQSHDCPVRHECKDRTCYYDPELPTHLTNRKCDDKQEGGHKCPDNFYCKDSTCYRS